MFFHSVNEYFHLHVAAEIPKKKQEVAGGVGELCKLRAYAEQCVLIRQQIILVEKELMNM